MADIELRFNKDMLVLSTPAATSLERMGINSSHDAEFALLFEQELYTDIYKMEGVTGAQCIVAPTATFTPARLRKSKMESNAEDLAKAALDVANEANPQHILIEIAPCGLPLDPSSKDSLIEHRDQYARVARLFENLRFENGEAYAFDAFFLNGFTNCTELKCALMGIRKVSDVCIFASVNVDANGVLSHTKNAATHETLEQAIDVMTEFGAQVVGFQIAVDIYDSPEHNSLDFAYANAEQLARRAKSYICSELNSETPLLVQLAIASKEAHKDISEGVLLGGAPSVFRTDSGFSGIPDAFTDTFTDERDDLDALDTSAGLAAAERQFTESEIDSMVDAATGLREAGVEFLRAAGDATPAFTGALVIGCGGDVVPFESSDLDQNTEATEASDNSCETKQMPQSSDIAALRQKVMQAINADN